MAAIAADRSLLFGLLALQNGLIDHVQLVAAFQAWTRDKARPLAEHLVVRGDLDAEQRSLLEGLVAQHLKKHGGDVEQSLAAVPAGVSIRDGLADLGDPDIDATLGQVGVAHPPTHTDEDDPDRTASLSVGTVTSDGQRFRVLRPHARGGLGAVFLALDTELHREVALKQILDSHADDPTSRQRFLLEAEVTGGLEHPGIVPVYGLGTYGDGRPYYAMRFIRGDSLKEAIDRFRADKCLKEDSGKRSLELRKLLRRFTDVCNAIDYAHSRGVLHRDIKPGNIIVGKYGETLVVDWGLAKLLGRAEATVTSEERPLLPSPASGSVETLPGSALGTPAYMSPEQARGELDALRSHSDVYSLGATLYCLLTGKAPFKADDVAAVLRAVQAGQFPPPRDVDPSVDPALEAICLKAMGREPETRYATPKALADDVERWMADEPVSAQPDRPIQALARWSRRHRSLTWSAAAALAVLAVSSTTAAFVVNDARGREASARIQADINSERATANFRLAQQAVDDYLTRVSENTLLKVQPSRDLRELRKALLEDALKFYRAFVEQGVGDPALHRDLARAYARVATITEEIGTKPAALKACAKALELRRRLANGNPGDNSLRVEMAETLDAVGTLQRSLGKLPECLDSLGEARATLEAVLNAEPDRPDALSLLGQVYSHSGSVHKESEEWGQAQSLNSRAREIFARLVKVEPREPNHFRNLAWSTYQVGNVLSHRRRKDADHARAKTYFETALALQRDLISAHPSEPNYPIDMAQCYVSLADMVGRGGDHLRAIRYLEDALDLQKQVVASHPSVTLFLMDLSQTCYNLGYQCTQLSRQDDALRWYREAIAAGERLVELDPENLDFQERLAGALNNHGYRLFVKGRTDEALPDLLRAIDIRRRVLAKAPQSLENRSGLLNSLLNAAVVKNLQGKPAEAVTAVLEARSLSKGFPEFLVDIASQLSSAGGRIADGTAEREHYLDLAMEALREALASGATKPGEVVANEDFAPLRQRNEFQSLVFDPAFPTDPFAHPK